MSFGIDTPQDENDIEWANTVDEFRKDNEMLHAENALKLTQILDLEIILYNTKVVDMDDKSPCWCVIPIINEGAEHEEFCEKARKSTEHLWKF